MTVLLMRLKPAGYQDLLQPANAPMFPRLPLAPVTRVRRNGNTDSEHAVHCTVNVPTYPSSVTA